jgi:hypothetical protein
MAIQASCPLCGRAYTLRDELWGKKVRCRDCRGAFLVRTEMEDSSDDADDRPRRRRTRWPGFVAAGGVATVVLFLGCGRYLYRIYVYRQVNNYQQKLVGLEQEQRQAAERAAPTKDQAEEAPRVVLTPDPKPRNADEAPVLRVPENHPPPAPPGTSQLSEAKGSQVNLLPLIDPRLDTVTGSWVMRNGELCCDQGNFVPRIQIPYQPPQEYDFKATFSQPRLRNGITLIMPNKQGGSFGFAAGAEQGSGFHLQVDQTQPQRKAGLIRANTRHTVVVQVRRNEVKAFVDGQLLVRHATDFHDLHADIWRQIKDPLVLAVACDDPVVYHAITVVEISGPGKKMR